MTKIEIIDDTVAYYSADVTRRSKQLVNNKVQCTYKGPEGRECAFQRVVEDDLSEYDCSTTFGYGESAASIIVKKEDLKFKEGYEGHDKNFWGAIQHLHDMDVHWDENGLSEKGNKYVEDLKETFSN